MQVKKYLFDAHVAELRMQVRYDPPSILQQCRAKSQPTVLLSRHMNSDLFGQNSPRIIQGSVEFMETQAQRTPKTVLPQALAKPMHNIHAQKRSSLDNTHNSGKQSTLKIGGVGLCFASDPLGQQFVDNVVKVLQFCDIYYSSNAPMNPYTFS